MAFRLWRWTEPGAPGRRLLCEGIGTINRAARGRPAPPASWRFAPLPSHQGEIWHHRAEALLVCLALTEPRGLAPARVNLPSFCQTSFRPFWDATKAACLQGRVLFPGRRALRRRSGAMKSTPPTSPNFSSSFPPCPASPLLFPSPKKPLLSGSDALLYSKAFELATKHPDAPAPLCLRDLPACAGCVGHALGTSPRLSQLPLASQRCCPGCCASSRRTAWPHAPRFGSRDARVRL